MKKQIMVDVAFYVYLSLVRGQPGPARLSSYQVSAAMNLWYPTHVPIQ